MAQRILEIHPDAFAEIRAAREWYQQRSRDASEGFFREVEQAITRVIESPQTWPHYLHGTRRFVLHRFPFSVVYRVTDEAVQIFAVAHARRRPSYWKSRTR